jgi:hypothetical protein
MALPLAQWWVAELGPALAAPFDECGVARKGGRYPATTSSSAVVVMGEGGKPVSCLLGEGRSKHPSLLDAVRNSSVESSIMAPYGDGLPL